MRGHLRTWTQKKMEDWGNGAVSTKVRVFGNKGKVCSESSEVSVAVRQLASIKIQSKTAGKNAEGPYLSY